MGMGGRDGREDDDRDERGVMVGMEGKVWQGWTGKGGRGGRGGREGDGTFEGWKGRWMGGSWGTQEIMPAEIDNRVRQLTESSNISAPGVSSSSLYLSTSILMV